MVHKAILIPIVLALTFSLVYAVTLTADATESVTVPVAALGEVCLIDSTTGDCTSTTGEILFGNAVVVNRVNDSIGLVLIQFGGQIYRAVGFGPVYEYTATLNDGTTVTATSRTLSEFEGRIESLEEARLLGLQGTLSQVLADGNEVYTTGEVRVVGDELKGYREEPVPVGEFYVEYDGLVLEDSDECGPYSYLDENGQPVKGISTRECVSRRGVMTAGEYTDLELTIHVPGGVSNLYKLTEITGTTSFEWEPE